MINVLIITSGLTAGGVDTLILNTLSELDVKRFHIDLLIFDDARDDWDYKFKAYGCGIIKLKRARVQGVLKAIKSYHNVFVKGAYDIVHTHIGFGSVLPVLAGATVKNCEVICHAHFDDFPGSKVYKTAGHLLFNLFPCRRLACSYGAGYALYGKKSKFTFVKNGIDSKKFSYNPQIRREMREKLNISEDTFVIGSVGRIEYQKNHDFLLDIFYEIHQRMEASKLILVGDGELRSSIEEKIKQYRLEADVLFLGIRNDVNCLLQAMDVFIMPTRFEGLSLALLEVQCTGLPGFTSDVVPKEAKVVEDFHFLSLSLTAREWADQVLKYRNYIRKDRTDEIKTAGFDKESAAKSWFEIYESAAVYKKREDKS